MTGRTAVAGFCPACGGVLFLDPDGCVTCDRDACADPYAAAKVLADSELDHLVKVTEDGWILRHPLVERIGDLLMTCPLNDALGAMTGCPDPPGVYVATLTGDGALELWRRS